MSCVYCRYGSYTFGGIKVCLVCTVDMVPIHLVVLQCVLCVL